MSFTIRKRDTFRWTVEHMIARIEGKAEIMSFDAEFRALPQSRVDELMKDAAAQKLTDQKFLDEVLAGWHGLADEAGEFAFDATNLAKLTETYPGIVGSIVRAYMDSIVGAAARKN